jgi:hypothetical protein
VFCAALAAANWATIRLELMGHPAVYLAMMLVIVLVLRVIWFGAMWLRRRKVAELNEVTRLLEEMETTNNQPAGKLQDDGPPAFPIRNLFHLYFLDSPFIRFNLYV